MLGALPALANADRAIAELNQVVHELPPVEVTREETVQRRRSRVPHGTRKRPGGNLQPVVHPASASEPAAHGATSGSPASPTTASQIITSGDELRTRPVARPGELLEAVPGLIVTQHSGEGKANQYFLRGFNLDHGTDLAIYVDDVPVNMRTHAHGQGYADLNWLIPETIAAMKVRMGPYFADEATSRRSAACISA